MNRATAVVRSCFGRSNAGDRARFFTASLSVPVEQGLQRGYKKLIVISLGKTYIIGYCIPSCIASKAITKLLCRYLLFCLQCITDREGRGKQICLKIDPKGTSTVCLRSRFPPEDSFFYVYSVVYSMYGVSNR